jgi:predicted phage tail protein
MAEKWVEVRLGGYLRQFGKSHRFLVSKPAEAIRAMCLQIKGFENAMRTAHHKGIKFAVFNGTRNVEDPDELWLGTKDVLRIVPQYEGSKSGLGTALVGALIIAAVVLAGPAGYAAAGGFLASGTAAASIAMGVGVSLLLGGVTQMLTPQTQGLSTTEDADNSASYAFGGPVVTTAQGNPVPLFYGDREVGGACVSVYMISEDQA